MKRSSKGRAYFYAYGKRDKLLHGESSKNTAYWVMLYRGGKPWPMWAKNSYQAGFNGY